MNIHIKFPSHDHGSLVDDNGKEVPGRCIDVGVDCHNYRPISFDEIKSIMDKKEIEIMDHHNKET